MEKRSFGRTDVRVSVLGFGGLGIDLEGADEATVAQLLGQALDAGGGRRCHAMGRTVNCAALP